LECPQVAARFQVFTDTFILAIRPADSPWAGNPGLGDTLQGTERVPFLIEYYQALDDVNKYQLAEFEPSDIAK
jgi:hypothetical protein